MRANLDALRLVGELDAAGRPATRDEQAVLARWSGWGAVPAVFDETDDRYATERAELAALLSPEQWRAAARSTLNAHYTDVALVEAMWDGVRALGFTTGTVLEPGCGIGTMLSLAPAGVTAVGVEVEPITAKIAAHLHPEARIFSESFGATAAPEGTFDLAIGNVPFGDYRVHDPRHNPARHSIHNHFLIKSLHLIRPGGLVVALTSRYTLDQQDPAARREMAQLADLVGAVRLPRGAHDRAAGTDVVTDLLILRRREPGRLPQDVAGWERVEPVTGRDGRAMVNSYFLAHPEAVLGDLDVVIGQYGPELTVRADRRHPDEVAADLRRVLADTARRAALDGLTYSPVGDTDVRVARAAALVPAGDRARRPEGFISADGDGFVRLVHGLPEAVQVPATQAAELRALLRLRDTTVALLEAEAASLDDTDQMGTLRADLNRGYDSYVARYGLINRVSLRRTGRVDPGTGEEKMARVRPPQGGFRDDPLSATVLALEHYDEASGTATKADIFRQRVVAPRAPRLGTDNPADAVALCMDLYGAVELEDAARLLGVPADVAREQLGTLVFDDPDSDELIPAAEYLSGQVRTKLARATEAAEHDPRFAVNVQALQNVIPDDLGPADIDARMGAAWIDAAVVQQFLRETLDDPRLRVTHAGGSAWEVDGARWTVLASQTWGTGAAPAPVLAESLLTQRPVQVFETDDDGRRHLHIEATFVARDKAEALQEEFGRWIWQDPQRAAELTARYNRQFNSIVLRSYDDVELTLPGLARTITPRTHQAAAVARIINEPTVLLAHEVGAGKTLEMVMGAMELRRLGLVTKPAIIVPNHMLDQFRNEFLAAYPQARLLAAGRDDLAGDRRRQFVARCATGDWDAIVMTRSAFERIPMDAATRQTYLQQEIDKLKDWADKARAGGGRSIVKRMEKQIAGAEERMERIASGKDDGLTFPHTGIDYLMVDEAHAYKNRSLVSNIPGVAIEGSQRAGDLHMKLHYLRERAGERGRVATFATATPLSNSVAEAYTMIEYLRPDLLRVAGIHDFDTWAATFGSVVTEIEVSPDGNSFRQVSRFARFRNVPELLRMFHIPADVKTAADLNLPTPPLAAGGAQTDVIPASPELQSLISDLGRRADLVRSRAVHPSQDNILKISSEGRMAALDLRLVGQDTAAETKLDVAAARIAGIFHAYRDVDYPGPDGRPSGRPGALQLVFSDLGTPRDGWNVYDELADKLVQAGIPRTQIRFIHDAKTDRAKGELFAAARSGEIAVLIGSTERMGVGTNVQARAIALHHLDCPWRPADLAQREGRILRQGNLNDGRATRHGQPVPAGVHIHRYVTEGSFDTFMWQTVERKARFIDQVMKGKLDVREIEDIGSTALSYAEVKALAAGNPLLLEHAQATADLQRLEKLATAWGRGQKGLRWIVTSSTAEIAAREAKLTAVRALVPRLPDLTGDRFRLHVAGAVHTSRENAGDAILAEMITLAGDHRSQWRRQETARVVATNADLHLVATAAGQGGSQITVTLGIQGLPDDFALPAMTLDDLRGQSAHGLISRVQNRLTGIASYLERTAGQVDHLRTERARAQQQLAEQQEFPKQAELDAARARLATLEKELNPPAPEAAHDVEVAGPAAAAPPAAAAEPGKDTPDQPSAAPIAPRSPGSAAATATSATATPAATTDPGPGLGANSPTAATARSTTIDPAAGPLTVHDEATRPSGPSQDPTSPNRRR